MRTMLRRLIKLTAILMVFFLCALGGLYIALRSTWSMTNYVVPILQEHLEVPLSASSLSVDIFSGIRATELHYGCIQGVGKCKEAPAFELSADKIELDYNFWALFSKTVKIDLLNGTRVRAKVNPAGDKTSKKSGNKKEKNNEKATQKDSERPASPWLVIAKDVTLKDSTFDYLTEPGRGYHLENITVSSKRLDSAGSSEIDFKSQLQIDQQGFSLPARVIKAKIVHNAYQLFLPLKIAVETTLREIKSQEPPAVQLDATIFFTKASGSPSKITIEKLQARSGLASIVDLSALRTQDFSYILDGTYSFGNPQRIDANLVVEKHRFESEQDQDEPANLAGTKLSVAAAVKGQTVTLKSSSLDLSYNEEPTFEAKVKGTYYLSQPQETSVLQLQSQLLDIDKLEAVAQRFVGQNKETTPENAEPVPTKDDQKEKAAKTPSNQDSTQAESQAELPSIDFQGTFERILYRKQTISDVTLEVKTENPSKILLSKFDGKVDKGEFGLSGDIDLRDKSTLKATAQNIDALILTGLAGGSGQIDQGLLKKLELQADFVTSTPRTSLNGSFNSEIEDLVVPSTLQQQVPFNLLFLPFRALSKVFGGAIEAILPQKILQISSSTSSVLSDAGRLGIRRGTLGLEFKEGKILFKDVDFFTRNLPDFSIKGNISQKDRLDFTMFIGLLKLNLPLPVAGTLESPLPNVLNLGPELIRGLGLSVGNIAGDIGSLVGGSNSKSKKTEIEEKTTTGEKEETVKQ